VTNDTPEYPLYAARSIYSLVRRNPGVGISLYEGPRGKHPWGIRAKAIVPAPWVIVLDADTWVNGDVRGLLPGADEDLALRVANVWNQRDAVFGTRKRRHWHQEDWEHICSWLGVPVVPLYTTGIVAFRGVLALEVKDNWEVLRAKVCRAGRRGKIKDPLHLPGRDPWWMANMYAMSLLISERGWRVRELHKAEVSWNFRAGEHGGIVHHLGKKRNPFDPKRWPNFRSPTS